MKKIVRSFVDIYHGIVVLSYIFMVFATVFSLAALLFQ